MPDLDAIFKAYDVRGMYPDQIDESVARASATRSSASRVRLGSSSGATPGRRRSRSSAPFIEGATTAGADVVDLGLASTDLVYFAAGPSRRARGDVHGEPQPGAVQRHQAVPVRRGARRRGDRARARSRRSSRQGLAGTTRSSAPRRRAASRRVTCSTSSSSTCARSSTSPRSRRSRSWPTPRTAWAGSSSRRCSTACRSTCSYLFARARRHVPEPPGRPDPGREPARTSSARSSTSVPTSGSPSTATPTASSSSTTAAQPVSGSTHDRDRRHARSSSVCPGSPSEDRRGPQPHLLEGGPRDRPRARRHARPHARRPLVHQAGDGRDRRDLRRRALRRTTTSATTAAPTPASIAALVVLEQLSRAGVAARRSCASRSSATRQSGEINRRVDDPLAVDRQGRGRVLRMRRRTASTGSPSISATGGSTCGRATPSRCCA